MQEKITLAEVTADVVNANFKCLETAVNAKASLNGDSTERFKVANAVDTTEAINKGQLDTSVASINSTISNLETSTDAKLATKLDKSDSTVTKQGNTFNGAGQLVQLTQDGKLPAVDGSLLTGLSTFTLDTSNMPTLANNATNPNTQIDFSAGFCYDASNHLKIVSSAMTKNLDANFVPGTGNGGLDTGSKTTNTWYHCFVISKTDGTSDFLFSLSATTPTMPADFVSKRRIGSIKTDVSGNLMAFKQIGNTFTWDILVEDVSESCTTSGSLRTISIPNGINVFANLWVMQVSNHGAGGVYGLVSSPIQKDIAPTGSIYNLVTYDVDNTIFYFGYEMSIYTNTNSQIRTRQNKSSGVIIIHTKGWTDNRGVN